MILRVHRIAKQNWKIPHDSGGIIKLLSAMPDLQLDYILDTSRINRTNGSSKNPVNVVIGDVSFYDKLSQ